MEWQPIETAPKDGSIILLRNSRSLMTIAPCAWGFVCLRENSGPQDWLDLRRGLTYNERYQLEWCLYGQPEPDEWAPLAPDAKLIVRPCDDPRR
jgi:hypothetical protein